MREWRVFPRWTGLAAALTLTCGATACREAAAPPRPRPSVLLVTVDTLRADRLGCYGRAAAETPAMDGLARAGLLFRRAYTSVPLTLPAHATLLTGLEPAAHGLVDNGMAARDLGTPTLAERLSGAGYDTAAFVAAHVLNRIFGLDRGFRLYDDGPSDADETEGFFHGVSDARGRVEAALAWLRRPRQGPFFAWLHLYDVHAPHVAPAPYAQRFAADPYDGEVAYVDSQLARLLRGLASLGLERDTLVVLTADHGEGLGEHGEETHGILLHDATLRVPLILRLPGSLEPGQVATRDVALADVTPTVLELCGLPPNPRSHGTSLLRDAPAGAPRALWAASDYPARQFGWAPLRSLRVAGFKFVEAPRPELYDLGQDPGETRDLAARDPRRVAEMRARLVQVERTLAEARPALAPVEPDGETRERLGALGYVADPGLRARALDPKDGVTRLALVGKAYDALESGALEAARPLFEEAVTQLPRSAQARAGLGLVSLASGDFAAAERHLQQALELDPGHAETLLRLAALATRRGDSAAELRYCRRLVELFPRHAPSHARLALALERASRPAEAEAAFREALALAPGARGTRRSWCRFLASLGRTAEAQAVLQELRREDAGDPALAELDRALERTPEPRRR